MPTATQEARADVCTTIELISRLDNGLQVRLFRDQHDDTIVVTVFDSGTNESFRLKVGQDEDPIDVFNHPFAYAAHYSAHLRCVRRRVPPATCS